jgi:protein subunit release factor A
MKKGISAVSKVKVFRELIQLEERIKHIKLKLELDAPFDAAPLLKQLHAAYDVLLIYEIQNAKAQHIDTNPLISTGTISTQFQRLSNDVEVFNLLFNQKAEDLKTVLLEIFHCNSKEEANLYLNSLYKLYSWHIHETVFLKFKNHVAEFFES